MLEVLISVRYSAPGVGNMTRALLTGEYILCDITLFPRRAWSCSSPRSPQLTLPRFSHGMSYDQRFVPRASRFRYVAVLSLRAVTPPSSCFVGLILGPMPSWCNFIFACRSAQGAEQKSRSAMPSRHVRVTCFFGCAVLKLVRVLTTFCSLWCNDAWCRFPRLIAGSTFPLVAQPLFLPLVCLARLHLEHRNAAHTSGSPSRVSSTRYLQLVQY